MNLRRRLVLTVVAVAAPLALGGMAIRHQLEWREVEQGLAEVALLHMEVVGHDQVLRDPARFPRPPARSGPGGRRRPRAEDAPRRELPPRESLGPRPADRVARTDRLEIFAYASDFKSANGTAPLFPEELRAELEGGAELVGRTLRDRDRRALQLGVRTEWTDGEDAFLLVTRATRLPVFWSVPAVILAMAIFTGVLGAVWVAAGPVVSRARRLERQVRRAAEERYATPVEPTGDDELTALAHAFNVAGTALHDALEVAERREATLRRFVENTAHDVGTPLTVLQGHLAALQRRPLGPPEAESLHGAIEEAQYITALLGNLAAAAQLEDVDSPPRRDRVELNALVERVVARHRPMARERGVELEFATPAEPVHVEAEMTLLEQALGNPVHNALRHGAAGGHVTVHLEVTGDQAFRLRVMDDGPGVPAEQLSQLTQRSWRGDEARQRFPDGHGLGLAIAREVADRHGFRCELETNEPHGLTVRFEGPLAEPAG